MVGRGVRVRFLRKMIRLAVDQVISRTRALGPGPEFHGPHRLPGILGRRSGNDCVVQCLEILTSRHFGPNAPSYIDLKHRVSGYDQAWTWTHQAALVLDDLGLDVAYHTIADHEPLLSGRAPLDARLESHLRTVPEITRRSFQECVKRGLLREDVLAFDDLMSRFRAGDDLAFVIDANTLSRRPGYRGHMVVLFDVDPDTVQVSGIRRGVERIHRDRFAAAWEAEGTDRDVLIVRGRSASPARTGSRS